MGRFHSIDSETRVRDVITAQDKSIILYKKVQAGKTGESLDLAQMFYKTSALVYIQDKNTALEQQNMGRAKKLGFTIVSYRDGQALGKLLRESVGKKVIISILMEINNVRKLEDILDFDREMPVTVMIDEADKNRNAIEADTKKKKTVTVEDEDDEEMEVADGSPLPPVTLCLFQIKNLVKERENSRTIFISATPQAILTAEKDDWVVIFKESYRGHVCKPETIHLNGRIVENPCKARDRWTNTWRDGNNTFKPAVDFGVKQFVDTDNRCPEEEILQVMLISLENIKLQQGLMSEHIKTFLNQLGATGNVGLVVFNSDTKTSSEESLASFLFQQKLAGKKKVIVIAGFMASRGVSFTDFSDEQNKFELVLQIHYTKKSFPLNSSMQNMRIFGPLRKTVTKPTLICNYWAAEDIKVNFPELHRIIMELAQYSRATLGQYNSHRPLTQPYNFRYLKQGSRSGYGEFIYPSTNAADHLPISI